MLLSTGKIKRSKKADDSMDRNEVGRIKFKLELDR